MVRRNDESRRTEKARAGLRHSRAKKRARRRLAGKAERVGSMQRATWLVVECFWLIQERLLWPASDRLFELADWLSWQTEGLAWTVRRRVIWPVDDRLAGSGNGLSGPRRRTLGAALAGLAAVALAAGAITASGGDTELATAEADPAPEGPSLAAVTEEPRPAIIERTEEQPDGPVLSGSRPRFESSAPEEVEEARRVLEAREAARESSAETDQGEGAEGTEPLEPDEASPGESGSPFEPELGEAVTFDGERSAPTPREQAKRVAFRFTRAFVAYERGGESEAIEATFAETASNRLAEELQTRPPRLPRDGRVPRAEVVNVVDGPREGRKLEVSVSLLRVESLAELRLDLFRTADGWRVGAVKG